MTGPSESDASASAGARTLQTIAMGDLVAERDRYDAAVMQSVELDRFCSSAPWILSAHEAFHAGDPIVGARLAGGYLAMARGNASGVGPFLAPLEAMWGLAAPLVGPDPEALVPSASELLRTDPAWRLLWFSGLLRDGRWFRALASAFGRRFELRLGPATERFRASLSGGFDGWLSRRSALFRKRLRASLRWAHRELEFEWFGSGEVLSTEAARALFERIHAVETRSWKGLEGTGFVAGDMRRFYERMVPELALAPREPAIAANAGAAVPSGDHRLRVLFARRHGEDVAVCFGGVLGDVYRGLQNSFDDRYREHSLGNVMQAESIRRLGEEGVAIYDLGSGMEYKARWSDEVFETVALLVIRR